MFFYPKKNGDSTCVNMMSKKKSFVGIKFAIFATMAMRKNTYFPVLFLKKVTISLIIISLCNTVFAIDNLIDGGRRSKTFSNFKRDINFSLKNGFNYSSYKILSMKSGANASRNGLYIVYRRDNISLGMSYKGKSKMLQKFKTPERPQ